MTELWIGVIRVLVYACSSEISLIVGIICFFQLFFSSNNLATDFGLVFHRATCLLLK